MPAGRSRRAVLRRCGPALAVALGVAGCIEDSSSGDQTVAPSEVSDSAAKERALAAEEEHLTERFRDAPCLTKWGVSPKSASTRAAVTGRTADGVEVEVTLVFWYSTDELEVDGASTAVYLVTPERAERVEADSASAC